ncbi:MAG: DUF1611 domain-containing protein [Candidatus Thermoplasmatota archaeon]|jgi:uncharacterized NAD-dependent epimerase/dehydratase family protein|nr:DUF1611 domain-containing protein [Candidatus Thermoplasmatota archaeon]MCL5785507.1 DUF1611 domain-containing protein [Candidatus Thermoplasmatota archaeon]
MIDASILAEGVFGTTYGKTANGLIRYSRRYNIRSVLDSRLAGKDAGTVINGKPAGIPVVRNLEEAFNNGARTLVVGIASDGGVLPKDYRPYIRKALSSGYDVVSGLHEFVSDDPEFGEIARKTGSKVTDVRKLFRDLRLPFTGRILDVKSRKIAVLGTDSAVGKRTTAVKLMENVNSRGRTAQMIGTGQTAWMQGFKHTVVLDAMINDFIPGGLEHVTVEAWEEEKPEFMFLEGQGSVMHPAYPGSFEIISACKPDAIILQHSPTRSCYDGFPQFPIEPVENYIKVLELISGKKVIAISLNNDGLSRSQMSEFMDEYRAKFGIPVFDPLGDLSEIGEQIIGKEITI